MSISASSISDGIAIAKLVGEVAKWAVETVILFTKGQGGEVADRLIELLPAKVRADAEHLREVETMKAALEQHFGKSGDEG